MAGFRSGRSECNACGNKKDSEPSHWAYLFVEKESCDENNEYVAKGGCGKDVREVSPGQGCEVSRHERQQEKYPEENPGIQDGSKKMRYVLRRDLSEAFHAARKKRIADGAKYSDSQQHEILTQRQGRFLVFDPRPRRSLLQLEAQQPQRSASREPICCAGNAA